MLSERLRGLKGSETLAITGLVEKMKSQGKDVISFTAGQLDFPTPSYIKDAAKVALDKNITRYTAVEGTAELKKAVIEWTKRKTGAEYDLSEVMISSGAKHAIYNVVNALLNEGDEAIMFSPYWLSYPEIVKSAGGVSVVVPLSPDTGFALDIKAFEKAITDKTRLVFLNSPNNPTGAVYPEKDIRALADVIKDKDITVISDEIYDEIIFGGKKRFSIASVPFMKEKTVVINGVSKSFAMTGWRIGWALGNKELIGCAKRLQAHSTSNPCSISQYASLCALTQKEADDFTEMVKNTMEKRCTLAMNIFSDKEKNIRAIRPEGAFYIMIDVSCLLGKKGAETLSVLSDTLIERFGVAVIPGESFGASSFVRISYALSEDEIKEGIKRIQLAFTELF
jgi:aspartate aminotransferase